MEQTFLPVAQTGTRVLEVPSRQDETEGHEIPAFIESNTSGITLDELERDCIIPTFADIAVR